MNYEDQLATKDKIEVIVEKLRTIRYEVNRLITDCECLVEAVRHMAIVDAIGHNTELTMPVVNPLQAPEITGADKDGDGGYAVRIELDE